jgi:tetratricopeptide (TPR) repeat protein
MLQVGQVIDGKYRIVRMLGRGGMGAVYEALHLTVGRRVAVKAIASEMLRRQPDAVARFQREAQAAGVIETRHIVQVLDSGVDPPTGLPYIVMELLTGEDLETKLKNLGPLPPQLVLRIAAQALLGLEKAHAASVVHRDIKAANVFLSVQDASEIVVKLVDFGIAKIRGDVLGSDPGSLTRTGAFMGSLEYISPEQAMGAKSIDQRTDLWSLGVVMYEALCGRTPHQDLGAMGRVIIAICQTPARPLRSLAPWVPESVAAIVHCALQIEAERRFQKAEEMFRAVSELLGGDLAIQEASVRSLTSEERTPRPHVGERGVAQTLVDGEAAEPAQGGQLVATVMERAARVLAKPPAVVNRPEPRPPNGLAGVAARERIAAAGAEASARARAAAAPGETPPAPEVGPEPRGVFAHLEDIYTCLQRWDSVLELYDARIAAIGSPAEKAAVHRQVARVRGDRLHDQAAAFEALLRALELDCESPEIWPAIESAASTTGRWPELVRTVNAWWQQATEPSRVARLGLALARWQVRRGRADDARPYLLRVLVAAAGEASLLRQLAGLYVEIGEYDDAAKALLQAREVARTSQERADVAFAMGELFERYVKDERRAIVAYSTCLDTIPGFTPAHRALERLGVFSAGKREPPAREPS